MDASPLRAAVPLDRLHALAAGRELPEALEGAALFADIAGFTALAGRLAAAVGPRRGAEELAVLLERVYSPLVAQIHHFGGTIVGFSGDALSCWFDQRPSSLTPGVEASAAHCAVTCGHHLLAAMEELTGLVTVAGSAGIGLKVAVSSGRARRLLLGDPQIQLLEVLAGPAVNRIAATAALAARGELLLDPATAALLADQLEFGLPRQSPSGSGVPVVALRRAAAPHPWPALPAGSLSSEQIRPWLPQSVVAQIEGLGVGLAAGLRPAVALMLRFALDDLEQPGAVAWLNTLVRRVQAIATAYEGTLVDVTMGDHGNFLYIAFGAPQAHDDDPARAVACAQSLRALEDELGARLAIGIASGTVRVGLYGGEARRSYGVIGEPPALACRLMDAAPEGAIWCDEAVVRQAGRMWAFTPLAPITVKGRMAPVAVFQPSGAPAPPAITTESLVGRVRELALFDELCAALARGQGRTLIVSGEAGIGKTRLLAELRRMLAERGLEATIGAGVSIAGSLAYSGWRELLAAFLGLGSARDQEARNALAMEHAVRLVPDLLARLPLLNDLLGLTLPTDDRIGGLDAQLRRASRDQLLIALMRAAAAAAPLAIVIEDAHWLDSLSWDLARDLAGAIDREELPILLVLSMRPLDTDHPALASLRDLLGTPATQHLELHTLPAEQTAALIARRLGVASAAVPEALLQLVAARSGGNPFFVEELVADMCERGVVDVGKGGVVAPMTSATALPETIEALLLARIDRLAPNEQITLKLAAVVGPTFGMAPLQRLCERHAPLADTVLHHQLHGLAARNFTALESPAPRLAYSFRHVLTHQAAYGSLLYEQRRSLHRTVAEWHEGDGSADYPLLVHHYQHAEDAERERHYARLAALGAADRYANREAIAYYSRALELTPANALAERFELLLAREQLFRITANSSAQGADLAELERIVALLDDQERRAMVQLRRGQYADLTGGLDAPELLEAAARLAGVVGAPAIEAEALHQLGMILTKRFELTQGQARLEQALEVSRAARLRAAEAETLRQLGVNAILRQDYQSALASYEQALAGFRDLGDRYGEAMTLLNIGICHNEQGDLTACGVYWDASLAMMRAIGHAHGEALVLGNMGNLYFSQGRLSAALQAYTKVQRFYQGVGDPWQEAWSTSNLGGLMAYLGAYERAEACFEASLRLRQAQGDREGELWIIYAWGHTLIELGRPAAAVTMLASGLGAARELNAPMIEGMLLIVLGRALLVSGRLAEAEPCCREARAIYQGLGFVVDCCEPAAYLAEIVWRRGDQTLALEELEFCLAQFARQPLIEFDNAFAPLLVCWRLLEALGDPRAAGLLELGRTALRQLAAGIDEPELRRSFLDGVPTHRALMAGATAL